MGGRWMSVVRHGEKDEDREDIGQWRPLERRLQRPVHAARDFTALQSVNYNP